MFLFNIVHAQPFTLNYTKTHKNRKITRALLYSFHRRQDMNYLKRRLLQNSDEMRRRRETETEMTDTTSNSDQNHKDADK